MAELYSGIAFSPQTTLTDNLGEADTIIKVADVSVFPDAPNLATIGTDEDGETILYAAKAEGILSGCQRGVEGTAKAWRSGEIIGRNFTAKDHNDLIDTVAAAQNTADTAQSTADAAQQTADKAVSDAAKAQASANGCLPLSGGKMTGAIVQVPTDGTKGEFYKNRGNGVAYLLKIGDNGFDFGGMNADETIPDYQSVILRGIESPNTNTDAANKLYVDSNRPNRNLLDNAHFYAAINQRSLNYYRNEIFSKQCSIDRWYVSASEYSVAEHRLTALKNYGRITQTLERERSAGKIVTFSVLASDVTGGNLVIFAGPGDIAQKFSNVPGLLSKTFVMPETVTDFNSVSIALDTTGASAVIEAAKLELGSTQTLAHKEGDQWILNDPPPNKALELLKCQGYQQVFRGYSFLGFGVIDGNHFCQYSFPTATPMRTQNVNVTINGSVRFYDGSAVYPSSESENFASCNIGVAKTGARFPDVPGGTPGTVYLDDDNYLILDANL